MKISLNNVKSIEKTKKQRKKKTLQYFAIYEFFKHVFPNLKF